MPAIPPHLIERAYDLYQTHSAGNGVEPDKLQFLCGVGALFGLLTGSIDVGIPEGTLSFDVLAQVSHELDKYRAEIAALEDEARRRTERRNK